MKKIKFTEDAEHQIYGIGHPDNPTYAAGQVELMRNDQADRWLNRSKAELLEDLGPDEIAGADPAKVEEIQQELERRNASEIDGLADSVAGARNTLLAALGQSKA